MSYIKKDTSGILNTWLTDTGRRKLSQGDFKVSYFRVGDSEVCYGCVDNLNPQDLHITSPQYNSQNSTGVPQSNRGNVKYPFFLDQTSGTTYGKPFDNSGYVDFFNAVDSRGFFDGSSIGNTTGYVVNNSYTFFFNELDGTDNIPITTTSTCTADGDIEAGMFVKLYYDPSANNDCGEITNNYPLLSYIVKEVNGNDITLDRELPNYQSQGIIGNGRLFFLPSGFTYYDYDTPEGYWPDDAFDFNGDCSTSVETPLVWNLNIAWSENPAGLFDSVYKGKEYFSGQTYLGTKEYLGYNSNSGQTDSSSVYFYNSFSQKVTVPPSDQKAIGIIHYTNNGINHFYGEKFATESYDPALPGAIGQARNFKVSMPTVMWHKSNGTQGLDLYIDPPGFDGLDLLEVQYMYSTPNSDMNKPGLRYYHLWDTNANDDGYPNRVGKVWPDLKIITIDDDELLACMTHKSNRNWSLPAPKLGLQEPNLCNDDDSDDVGILSGSDETLWVTYVFENSLLGSSMHCNYYQKIVGTDVDCPPDTANVSVIFGSEFPFMNASFNTTPTGFTATNFYILAQKVATGERPSPSGWRIINYTSQVTTNGSGYIVPSSLTNTPFVISKTKYESSSTYNLNNFVSLVPLGDTGISLNFGQEYAFFGNVKTDIQATVYEMKYLVNLPYNQFNVSTNPTHDDGETLYISEIGLYDSNNDLLVLTKTQSPIKREGVQQFIVKYDF